MKAITSAFSLVALLGALVILPGCGGGDEALPPADTTAPGTIGAPGDDYGTTDDAMGGPPAEPMIDGAMDESVPAP